MAHGADEPLGERSIEQALKAEYESDHYGLLKGDAPPLLGGTPENEVESALEASFHGMTLPNEEKVEAGAPGCQRCEAVPLPLRGPGTVHLNVAHTHTLGKMLQFLRNTQWQYEHRRGVVSVRVAAGGIAPLLSPILSLLSPVEIRNCRALFQSEGHLAQPADYFKIESLPAFVARERSSWLLDILREQRLRSVFQPIVRCDEVPREIYGYECLLRGDSDGLEVMPAPMIEMAREADLIFQLDLAARRTAILSAAAHDIRQKVFINFTPNAIYVPQQADRAYIERTGAEGIYPLMYYSHNLHFLAIARSFEGRYADALRAAQQLGENVSPHIKAMPMLEGFNTTPILVMARFRRWDEILRTTEPPREMPGTNAFWHWARGMALAATGRHDEAEGEYKTFAAIERAVPPGTMIGLNKASDIFKIADNVLAARIAASRGDSARAVEMLRAGVAVEDSLAYDEPPAWFMPVRESLGAALLSNKGKAAQAAEAEAIFREDLRLNPRNGRSLFGLLKSLEAQHKRSAAAKTAREFADAWKYADTQLKLEDL